MANNKAKHTFRFFRAGGFDQVELSTGEDLLSLDELDQKLWVALACPTDGLELDPKTLELIDTDKDGRIRAPELIAALEWAGDLLKDPSALLKGSGKLSLAALNDSSEAKAIAASAKQILKDLGKKGAESISVDDTTDTAKIFSQMELNGDGVVPPKSAGDEDLKKAISDMMSIVGSVKDRSGEDGIDTEKLEKFFAEAEAYSAWHKAAADGAATILPLGDATASAAETLGAIKEKVEDYFTRVRLAAFDDRALGALNRDPAEYATLSPKLLKRSLEEIAALPIAKIEKDAPLPLAQGINPAWEAAVKKLSREVIAPLFGERAILTEDEWTLLCEKLSAFETWRGAKAGGTVEPLGLPRVRELIEGGYKGKILGLIEKDKALEPEASAIAQVDKLVRYHRDLIKLTHNFVTFRDFYARKKAIFQIGTLYLDGRSCDLCIKVADAGAHSAVAGLSGIYLVYCDLNRKGTGEKMTIAAAFTNGDTDNLAVGRNGIFYDRKGNDWDATITKIVENPISIRQAFWAPYRRVAKLIEEQIDKFAASRDKEMQDKTAANVADTGKAAETAPGAQPAAGAAPAAFDVAKYAGIFAAIGLALGMLGSALAAVATGFLSLTWWQMPFAILGILVLISGPSMLLAYMKLRKRNIGPMMDGAGWAVNARARVNVPFGRSLTQIAALPEGAQRSLNDPFEEKKRPWVFYVVLVLLLGAGVYFWRTGHLKTWMNDLTAPPPAASGAASASAAPSGSAAPAK